MFELGVAQLRERMARGHLRSTEVVDAFLNKAEELQPQIGAFITLNRDSALARAEALDKLDSEQRARMKLFGVPVAVKDNICVRGGRTTCASRILSNFISPYDATVVSRLADEGAVIIGKTNLDEFAMGSSTETSCFGVTRNPLAKDRTPGGSSGGSAAAVAAGCAACALGTDTGGSIRQPASFCGVVGLKPTYGRVSRYGLIAFAPSFDQIGPITRSVEDAALLLEVIAGFDEHDSTSVRQPVPEYSSLLEGNISKKRIGVIREHLSEGITEGVRRNVESALELLQGLGATIVELSLPHLEYAVAVYYILGTAEASSNLLRYDGVRYGHRAKNCSSLADMYRKTRGEGFAQEVKRRIVLGTFVLSMGYYEAYYIKAQKVRTLIIEDFKRAFAQVDYLAGPASPQEAFKLGEKIDDPLLMYLSDIFTIPANLAGLPAISVPCGLTKEGLPVGLQIVAKPFDETGLLQVAYALQLAYNTRTGD